MSNTTLRRPALALLTGAFLLLALSSPRPAAAAPATLESARECLRLEQYDAALKALSALPPAVANTNGEAIYLKSLAAFYKKDYAGAARAAGELTEFPESPWYRKAIFLKARALYDQKKFQDAEAIYAQEAARLLSAERKRDIVGVVVRFADELATEPPPDALDATPPNFGKAANLYAKALEMEIDRDLREDLIFKRARAVQKSGDLGQAQQQYAKYLAEFDPDWSGAGRPRPENPLTPGKHRLEARRHLAEAYLSVATPAQARREAEDLLRFAEKAAERPAPEFLADVQWLMVQTYRFPGDCGANWTRP